MGEGEEISYNEWSTPERLELVKRIQDLIRMHVVLNDDTLNAALGIIELIKSPPINLADVCSSYKIESFSDFEETEFIKFVSLI
jgi:hypothetical protein